MHNTTHASSPTSNLDAHALLTRGRALRWSATTSRVLLGLVFFVCGLDGFLHFFPTPEPEAIPEAARSFASAMLETGYLFQLVKGTEMCVGALLLVNRFVPLALTLLAPVMVNIVLFNALLAPGAGAFVLTLVALHLFLAWTRRDVFAPLLRAS